MAIPSETQIEYFDLPNVHETFVDSVRLVQFDGMTMRMELCVTRSGERKNKGEPLTLKVYPASRTVMTADAALDLFEKLQQVVAAMEQRGILKRKAVKSVEDARLKPLRSEPNSKQ